MKIIDVKQGSEEWHKYRNRCVCASDWSVILGLSEYSTQYQLWETKLGLRTTNQTLAMKQGHQIEDEARLWFHREYGHKVVPTVATHDDNSWLLASFDGINLESEIIVEIKNVKKEYHEMACSGIVPEQYFAQCQAQMYVSGWNNVHYLSYKRGNPAVVIIPRDNNFIAESLPKLKEFYECVNDLVQPDLTDRDYVDVSDDMILTEMAQQYKMYSQEINKLESKYKFLKEEIRTRSQDRNVKGKGFKMTKYPVRGRFDYDAILKHHNINLELCQQFKKPTIVNYRITVE